MVSLYGKISDPFDRHSYVSAHKEFDEGGMPAVKDYLLRELYNDLAVTSIVVTGAFFPGAVTQVARLPRLIRGGMTFGQFMRTYGGNFSPFPSLGVIAARELYSHFKKSPRQDTLTSTPGVRVPKTRGGTRSSRGSATAGPQTLKPFWSNGKPKCRKGYRYDFARKMCVKI
jgi:hypothetical protein